MSKRESATGLGLRAVAFAAGCLLLGVVPGAAVDGVREINMTCAAVGCWPGDDPGLPVRIVETGSYRLTSGLVVDENTTAVVVAADDVSLDLNGFTVQGPTVVTAGPAGLICSVDSLNGHGIQAEAGRARTAVRNGSIVGIAGHSGIFLGTGSRVADVSVAHICGAGIVAGDTSSVTESRARLCQGPGVKVGDASRVVGVIADFSGFGITTRSVSLVSEAVATSNTFSGVLVWEGSVVSGNTVSFNGIIEFEPGTISGGPILLKDGFLGWNGEFGFKDSTGSGQSGFGGNVFAGNGFGGADTGANTQCNVVNGTSFCPSHP